MKGRKPKPASLLLIEKGKVYGEQRDRIENEPKPKKDIQPKCPAHFSPSEKKQWRYYAKILKSVNLFTLVNGPILELLARNFVEYYDCLENVKATGLIIYSPNGYPICNPCWTAKNKCEQRILKCLEQLGLSSIGLARLGSLNVKGKKKSEFEEMLD